MRNILSVAILTCLFFCESLTAQETFPVNGVPDKRNVYYAFTNARIQIDHQTVIDSSMLLIRNGMIEAVGKNLKIPDGAVIQNMSGKWIYPSFIDPYTNYGMAEPEKTERRRSPQLTSNTKGAYHWNQALKPEVQTHRLFVANDDAAERFRKAGFGLVLTHQHDGIARGTASVVSLARGKEQELVIVEKAAACYSFKKGSSNQDYPTSEMGAIALLRQSFLDAEWYKAGGGKVEYNISIQSWIDNQGIPQIFECDNYLQSLRVDKVGDEFGINYIIKGSGDEYKRLNEIKATGNSYLLPLKFPDTYDVADPYDAINISLEELMHWENAPANAYFLDSAGVPMAFTSFGLKDVGEYLPQIRKIIGFGLPTSRALKAATETPAKLLQIADKAGALRKGMLANFFIASGDIFEKETIIFENWIQGKQHVIRRIETEDIRGDYALFIDNAPEQTLRISGDASRLNADVFSNNDTVKAMISFKNNVFSLKFDIRKGESRGTYVLTGFSNDVGNRTFSGTGFNPAASTIKWNAKWKSAYTSEVVIDTLKKEKPGTGKIFMPARAYGFEELPLPETVLIKDVTVWTNEKEGILENTDVLISKGKIAAVGKGLDAVGAAIISGTGMHLTAGIIDEHSHIAVSNNVNECSHAVTAEVRIGDVINPDDINIYRQLSGGVTTSQLLHGSCNPIGGQSAIIKLRWGMAAEKLKFEGAPGFIKFALGENVKQANWGDDFKSRYPQTRMGVEQVYVNAFSLAIEYENAIKNFNPKSNVLKPRRDLRLETLTEIMNNKRHITCHSYQQGEINMLMKVADSMGFKVNTFTHILEGYKVADKMKEHGAGASSFSDWWAYKFEVIEAIPQNGPILHDVGVVVAYNSDDAEMARRLNQEAAKAVKYGGMSEEEALKFVTLNPAKLLRIDNRVGSIKVGKDADVVLWNNPPLSIYAKAIKTYIDGVCYYDAERDEQLRIKIATERARILKKMIAEGGKSGSGELKKPSFKIEHLHHCMDDDDHGL